MAAVGGCHRHGGRTLFNGGHRTTAVFIYNNFDRYYIQEVGECIYSVLTEKAYEITHEANEIKDKTTVLLNLLNFLFSIYFFPLY